MVWRVVEKNGKNVTVWMTENRNKNTEREIAERKKQQDALKRNASVEAGIIRRNVLLTGQLPTLPKGYDVKQPVTVISPRGKTCPECGERFANLGEIIKHLMDKHEVVGIPDQPSSIQNSVREGGILASGLTPLGGKEQERELDKLQDDQHRSYRIFYNTLYNNVVDETTGQVRDRNELIKNFTLDEDGDLELRPTQVFLANYVFNNQKDMELLGNKIFTGTKATRDAMKKQLKVFLEDRDVGSNWKGGSYTSRGISDNPLFGSERPNILGNKFSYRYTFQILNGVRVYGFRNHKEAIKAGLNYLTSNDPNTGKPRYYGILNNKKNGMVLEALKRDIARRKRVRPEDVKLKDIDPRYLFWTDDIGSLKQKRMSRSKERTKMPTLAKNLDKAKEELRLADEKVEKMESRLEKGGQRELTDQFSTDED